MNTNTIIKAKPISQSDLDLINKFALNPLNEKDVFKFSVVLCTNDIDRDFESFTPQTIEKLAKMFIGKTGIFDHRPNAANQSARIFKTHVETTDELTSFGEPKVFLKADAYMVKCAGFEHLIKKINAGILKEISISCNISRKVCSICNKTFYDGCSHQPGQTYAQKTCFLKLIDPLDAYEWSFVPIPAQPGAHTIKRFNVNQENSTTNNTSFNKQQNLEKQVLKLGFLCGFNETCSKNSILNSLVKKLNFNELEKLKSEFEGILQKSNLHNNIVNSKKPSSKLKENLDVYLI